MAGLRPMRDEVIVALEASRGETRSGLIVVSMSEPDDHTETEGELLAVTERAAAKLEPEGVGVGDRVVFDRTAGDRIDDPTDQGRRLVRLRWSDIQGVIQ